MQAFDQATTVLLRTLHGNAVHFEPGTRRLVHGPALLDEELRLLVDGSGGRLALLGRQGPRGVLIAPGNGVCRLVPIDQATRFTMVEDSGGPLGLFTGDTALHALPDGALCLRDGPVGEDAFFFAITEQARRCAGALRADRWVDLTTGAIHPPASPVPGQWHQLAIAGRILSIAGTRDPFVVDAAAESPLHRLHVVLPDGAILPLARYRPLIYFAVYGPERYFECLALALQSMAAHGGFDGTLCIASDRGRDGVSRFVPEAFAGRWLHRETSAEAGLFARYECIGWALEAFSPLLYLDADVIINAPLTPLLTRLAASRRLHVSTSNRFAPHLTGHPWRAHASDLADWFGNWLFGHDPRLADLPFAMGGSGTIGFSTVGDARLAFDTVRALRRSVRYELVEYFGDQPLFNYALHVLGCGEFAALDAFLDFARHAGECGEARRGLMHFHAGVGNVDVKHEAMLQYMAWLETQPEAAVSSNASGATRDGFRPAI
jgi:hypothetical protein